MSDAISPSPPPSSAKIGCLTFLIGVLAFVILRFQWVSSTTARSFEFRATLGPDGYRVVGSATPPDELEETWLDERPVGMPARSTSVKVNVTLGEKWSGWGLVPRHGKSSPPMPALFDHSVRVRVLGEILGNRVSFPGRDSRLPPDLKSVVIDSSTIGHELHPPQAIDAPAEIGRILTAVSQAVVRDGPAELTAHAGSVAAGGSERWEIRPGGVLLYLGAVGVVGVVIVGPLILVRAHAYKVRRLEAMTPEEPG
ncbi:MAG: hypothetical protein ACKVU4_01725 [Phycisphaerales bacterium]